MNTCWGKVTYKTYIHPNKQQKTQIASVADSTPSWATICIVAPAGNSDLDTIPWSHCARTLFHFSTCALDTIFQNVFKQRDPKTKSFRHAMFRKVTTYNGEACKHTSHEQKWARTQIANVILTCFFENFRNTHPIRIQEKSQTPQKYFANYFANVATQIQIRGPGKNGRWSM